MKGKLRHGKIIPQNLADSLIGSVGSILQIDTQAKKIEASDVCLFFQKEHKVWTILSHLNMWNVYWDCILLVLKCI